MPKMLAIKKEFHYGRKTVKAGEIFDVLDKDVKLLRALRHARDPDPVTEVPKTQKAPEPRAAEAVVTQALQPEPHDGHENPTEIKVRRTYRRRDLTSEE
jgi:hypothetical protein